MDTQRRYQEASTKTATNLRTIAHSDTVRSVSHLSLPEIDAVADLVARMVPAGNVPGVILNGLARLAGRKPPLKTVRRDVNLLFRGVDQALDRALYAALFAGPAAVIWGYQNLLRLAGKNPDDAFPEGTWQFYVDYALREDTARHCNETHGFDTALKEHHINLSPIDRATAWTMAAIHCLHQYDALLENEWRERIYTHVLRQVVGDRPGAERYRDLYRQWEGQRPYGRGADVRPTDNYPTYRRLKFDRFLESAMQRLSRDFRREWLTQVRQAESESLAAYQRQMSILAYLEPGTYGDARTPIALQQACVGIIFQGNYYLLPVCSPGTAQPPSLAMVRSQIAALMARPAGTPPPQLASLAGTKRVALGKLRTQMSEPLLNELDALRFAPILLNCDLRPRHLPLSELRQAERGIGQHALTIFDTGETQVFDQSHIFFDGIWGAALAEVLSNEALAWAVYLNSLSPARPAETLPRTLNCHFRESERELFQEAPQVVPEVSAETEGINLPAIQALRRLFKRRSDLLELTVNDLLVLYRAIHAATYQPPTDLVQELRSLVLENEFRQAAQAALEAIEPARPINPAILILVDASQRSPRDRVYPMTFEVPLGDLKLLNLHRQVVAALDAYQGAARERTAFYQAFDRLQRSYLATLAGFGLVMSRAKEIAVMGESASIGSIRMLAHMPTPLQRMLDHIPGRFDVLNDIIKGREVFSNVGVVDSASTLTRFTTAKDDNDKKILAWGVITDAERVMHLSLRDFRPHVGLLAACGRRDLAVCIVQDYVDACARGLNEFVHDLQRITRASRETHSQQIGGER